MGLISPTLPTIGQQRGDGEVAVRSTLVALLNEFNGNIDTANISAGGIQSSDLASGVIKAKPYPATVIATQETRSNTAYGLMTTPDQVQNVVVPTNGILLVFFQARWQESVVNAARCALFIGSNQVKASRANTAAPQVQETALNGTANQDSSLFSTVNGISCNNNTTAYTGDVTTGQIIGGNAPSAGFSGTVGQGGPMAIFAAAGTYDISIQFKASSGNVLVRDRKLWVAVLDFS